MAAVAQVSSSLCTSRPISSVFVSIPARAFPRIPITNSTPFGTSFSTGSPLLIQGTSLQKTVARKATAISIRCEQGTKDGSGLDVWLGRLAMVGFAVAITVEISTGKGLLENFGLTSPLPTVALAVTALRVIRLSALGTTVCVTGASGYIASWLVKFLLQRGYTVKASVRNLNDPKKTEHLLAIDGAKDRLHLFKANLLEEGSFDAVVAGCEGVFHTASPFTHSINDPQAELIDPALKGTLNVLGSCAKAPSVKRVVLTSSMAAVTYNGRPRTPDVVVDETWFSNAESCKEMKLWYVLSKTLAEDAAWKFVKQKGIDMVTINPAMVIGPLLQPTLNTSAAAVLNIINGAQTYPNFSFGWVNVKDVANAHILAFEIPSASGRYCMVETVAHYSEIVDILRKLYPSFQLPDKCANEEPFMPTYQVSKEKIKSLGIDYIPMEDSLKETVESLKEKKFFGVSAAM